MYTFWINKISCFWSTKVKCSICRLKTKDILHVCFSIIQWFQRKTFQNIFRYGTTLNFVLWWPSSWIFFHTKKNLNFIRVHLPILPVVALKKTLLSTFFIWSYIKQSPVMATILDYQSTWILLRTIQGIIESIFPIKSVVLQKYNFSNIFHIGFNFKYLSCNGDHLGFLIHM